MATKPTVSVIINTYNRPGLLREAVRALLRQEGAERWPFEIIVADDGSNTDPEGPLREAGAPGSVRLLREPHRGPCGARNAGLAAAQGEWVVFLGDDIIAHAGLVAAHAAFLEQAAGSKSMSLGLSRWDMPGVSRPFRDYAQAHHFDGLRAGQALDFRHFYTANVALPRRALDEAGGFDEAFTSYGWDDTDLGYRLEKAGWRLVFNPEAKAEHKHPALTPRDLARRQYELGLGGCRFYAKHRTAEAERVSFWPGSREAKSGPDWRRRLGWLLASGLERAAPESSLLQRTYDRLVFSSRCKGVADGRKAFPNAGI